MVLSKEKILFIVNPISGGKSKDRIENIIDKEIDKSRFSWNIQKTRYAGHATEILLTEKFKYQAIIAVGGDGTVNEIANQLINTNIALGIIPMGSGNGLARHLHIPLKPGRAISYLNKAVHQKVDTIEMNGHFFVSIAGVGFDSLIAAEFEKQKGRGFVNYAKLTIKEYFRNRDRVFEFEIDGKKYQRKAFMISFANSNQFGYGTLISPKADLSDGLVDVCVVQKPRLWQMPKFLWQMFSGKTDQSKLLEIFQAKEIKLQPNKDLFANIDGESIKVGEQIHVVVKPASLNILKNK